MTDLERLGPALRRPDADFIAEGIYELRFRAARVEYRILYFFAEDRVVLAHGFVKKSAAVQKREFEKAASRREIWRMA
ncbi:type II toxin-antitoxin system RelE/ParE family toxin [bacterium]|nr:MAG: type II toxin-antitoxin system RelE/ParE family toxin [bacterium]